MLSDDPLSDPDVIDQHTDNRTTLCRLGTYMKKIIREMVTVGSIYMWIHVIRNTLSVQDLSSRVNLFGVESYVNCGPWTYTHFLPCVCVCVCVCVVILRSLTDRFIIW